MTKGPLIEYPTPWAELGQRWGHPWHAMSSYLGAFPAALARSMIVMLSDEGDTVLDPFSGRGTTLLEGRLTGRLPLASDLNPIARALTGAKNTSVNLGAVLARTDELEADYDSLLYLPEAQVQPDDILLIYHPRTLAQLCYLRRQLLSSGSETDQFLIGVVLGIMHGSERQDGSSAYASISMPNTFSMSPAYVRRFVETKRLQRVERNVFVLLREKVQRLLRESADFSTTGVVRSCDIRHLASDAAFSAYRNSVRLVVTSPPYLNVVNYAKQNWIRNWFLEGYTDHSVQDLDDNLTLARWLAFMDAAVAEIKQMLASDGVMVLVVGDVIKSSSTVISLAREFIRCSLNSNLFRYVGCFSDRLEVDAKTTRIWKETKGRATEVDRIVIMADSPPEFRCERLGEALFGHDLTDIPVLDAVELADYAERFAS